MHIFPWQLRFAFYTEGLPFDGSPIEGQSLGGSESALWYMAQELTKRGARVEVYCRCPNPGVYEGVRYVDNRSFASSGALGEWDVFVAHRFAYAHAFTNRSKMNWTWLHDMPAGDKRAIVGDLWKSELTIVLSEYQRAAYLELEAALEPTLHLSRNGVDIDRVKAAAAGVAKESGLFVYASRPERGLHRLLTEIWPEIRKWRPDAKLAITSYDMRSYDVGGPMRQFYDECRRLIARAPGVVDLGSAPKAAFWKLLAQAELVLYPTSFPEVSCITALEAMAVGTPIVTTHDFALTETVPYPGVPEHLSSTYSERFVERVKTVLSDELEYKRLAKLGAKHVHDRYRWSQIAVEWIEKACEMLAWRSATSRWKIFDQLVYQSDLVAARSLAKGELSRGSIMADAMDQGGVSESMEWGRQLRWIDTILAGHHEEPDAYSEGAGEQVNQGWDENPRFARIAKLIPPGTQNVVDVGCGAGGLLAHLHVNRPGLRLTGIDFSPALIDRARVFLEGLHLDDPLELLPALLVEDIGSHQKGLLYDVVISAEVLEHQIDTQAFVAHLEALCRKGGKIILTVPSGPWEAMSFTKPARESKNDWDANRFHVHAFEARDLEELFGKKKDFTLEFRQAGKTPRGEIVGWWFASWTKGSEPTGKVDYERKRTTTRPYQSLAYCMIVKDEEDSLARNIRSVIEIPDRIHIVDTGSSDGTVSIIEAFRKEGRYRPQITYELAAWEDVRPPKAGEDASRAELGTDRSIEERKLIAFDRARNRSVDGADGTDWILWADADEIFKGAHNIRKYLDTPLFPSLVIRQRHITLDPEDDPGVDTPYRLFRTDRGLRFYGVVHEQPGFGPDRNPEPALHLGDVEVVHLGYLDKATIRMKAVGRNMPLVAKDRFVYPERTLGKLNVMRDTIHLALFEIEKTGGMTERGVHFLREAVALFQETFTDPEDVYYSYAQRHYQEALRMLGAAGQGTVQGSSELPLEVQLQLAISPGGINDDFPIAPAQRRWFATRAEFETYFLRELHRILGRYGDAYGTRPKTGSPAARRLHPPEDQGREVRGDQREAAEGLPDHDDLGGEAEATGAPGAD